MYVSQPYGLSRNGLYNYLVPNPRPYSQFGQIPSAHFNYWQPIVPIPACDLKYEPAWGENERNQRMQAP